MPGETQRPSRFNQILFGLSSLIFIYSEKADSQFASRVGNGWIAKKVLGQGGFGIVGHWIYIGQNANEDALRDIVVKQGSSKNGGLRSEADHYMAFNTSKSLHIPRMYRRIYVEQGRETVNGNYDTGEVHRMFLEYCAGGDLSSWLKTTVRR